MLFIYIKKETLLILNSNASKLRFLIRFIDTKYIIYNIKLIKL